MAAYHVGGGEAGSAECEGCGMYEYCRLCDAGGAEVFIGPSEHSVGYAESQYFIRFFHQKPCLFTASVKVLSHARELGTLAWEHV